MICFKNTKNIIKCNINWLINIGLLPFNIWSQVYEFRHEIALNTQKSFISYNYLTQLEDSFFFFFSFQWIDTCDFVPRKDMIFLNDVACCIAAIWSEYVHTYISSHVYIQRCEIFHSPEKWHKMHSDHIICRENLNARWWSGSSQYFDGNRLIGH